MAHVKSAVFIEFAHIGPLSVKDALIESLVLVTPGLKALKLVNMIYNTDGLAGSMRVEKLFTVQPVPLKSLNTEASCISAVVVVYIPYLVGIVTINLSKRTKFFLNTLMTGPIFRQALKMRRKDRKGEYLPMFFSGFPSGLKVI